MPVKWTKVYRASPGKAWIDDPFAFPQIPGIKGIMIAPDGEGYVVYAYAQGTIYMLARINRALLDSEVLDYIEFVRSISGGYDKSLNPLMKATLEMAGDVTGKKSLPVVFHVKSLRKKFGLTQAAFAERFGFTKRTIQDWEQGRTVPSHHAYSYLRVIERCPDQIIDALEVSP